DLGYEDVFARQVEALGRPGDVVVGISTSGTSPNIIRALETGRRQGLTCLALGGRDGGLLPGLSELALVVPSDDTQHIQEAHTVLIHLICGLVERQLCRAGEAA